GNFHVPGATSLLPKDGGLDPEVGVDLDYFLNEDGFAKETAHMPGVGPTWIDGLVTLRDGSGKERRVAKDVEVRAAMEVYVRGTVEFDPESDRFEKVVAYLFEAPLYPAGHPFVKREGDVDYIYFATPYPLVRVRADVEAIRHPERFEAYTCLEAGS